MVNETMELARFIERSSFRNFSKKIIEKAKLCILDTLGVMLAGALQPNSKIMVDLFKNLARGKCTIVGCRNKVISPHAALVNGTAAHSLDYDDWHSKGAVHPGVVAVPAAMAMAEEENSDGKDFIVSVILGYETDIRVGMGCLGSGFDRGFHPTGTCGPFGAAASACKILNLNAEEIANAFGLAGSQASGIMEFMESDGWVKRMHAGWAALGGVIAASLAKKGYTGPTTVLEGKYGYCKAYSSNQDARKIVEKLGVEFEIMNVQHKIYACCSELFSAIDAAIKIVQENGIKPNDIDKITVRGIRTATKFCSEPRDRKCKPETTVDAQFSLPYSVAVGIIKGRAGLPEYSEEMIRNTEVIDLAEKVEPILDPDLDRMFPGQAPAIVEIITKDNKKYHCRVDDSRGTPVNPMTTKELQDKFRECSTLILENKQVEEIIKAVDELDKISDIKELTKLLI